MKGGTGAGGQLPEPVSDVSEGTGSCGPEK